MDVRKRYLTKSRFKMALECPTKLYYSGHSKDYYDRNKDNDFLQALADGGYQIGELAKFKYHPDPIAAGITVETLEHAGALRETETKLAAPGRVFIAEAALGHENFFIRVDILIRDEASNTIELIEVKSKSIDQKTIDNQFKGARGGYIPDWLPYLYDITFQTEVARHVFPGYEIKPRLMLINSGVVCDTDALHQKFKIVQKPSANGRQRIDIETPEGLTQCDLGNLSILIEVDVERVVNELRVSALENTPHIPPEAGQNVPTFMTWASDLYREDAFFFGGLSKTCKTCQFRAGNDDKQLSGVHQCWSEALKQGLVFGAHDLSDRSIPLSVDIWGGGSGPTSMAGKALEKHRAFLADIKEDDIRPAKSTPKVGINAYERRMAQIEAANGGDALVLAEDRLEAMDEWEWPLHMIDFETSAPAIPFFKGMRPYQTIAFQFSHHIMEKGKDGWVTVRHANQWISTAAQTYPSIEFVRQLRKALMPDGRLKGTVFRYHNHENTVLRNLRRIIEARISEIPDAEELIQFILLITKPTNGEKGLETEAEGPKSMVDLHKLVQEGYYSGKAGGSISLKYILPAILNDARATASVYAKPGIYGARLPIESLNFGGDNGHVWLQADKKNDPYKTLPKIFGGKNDELDSMLARLAGDEDVDGDAEGGSINQGGLAMTAYNYTQFASLSNEDRNIIEDALLRYCELDTLAMVILVQGLMELRGKAITIRGVEGK